MKAVAGLRKVARHQSQQSDMLLPIEVTRSSANTIAEDGHPYEHCIGKLGDRNKHVAEYFSVIVLRCAWQRSHPKLKTWCTAMVSRTRKH